MNANELADAEIAALGATLLAGRVLVEVSDRLRAEHFADRHLRQMYGAALEMTDRGQTVDPVSMMSRLTPATPSDQVDALRSRLQFLAEAVATTVNVAHHARLVEGYAGKRALRAALEHALTVADAADPLEVAQATAEVIDGVAAVSTSQTRGYVRTTAAAAARELVETQTKPRQAEYAETGTRRLIGIPTGLHHLDDIIDGWGDGHLHVVGARSGHGKTAFCTWTAMRAAERSGRPSLYISAEIRPNDLGLRQLASRARVNSRIIESGALKSHEVDRVVEGLAELEEATPTEVVFCPGAKVGIVRREVQRCHRRPGADLGLVVVDYLQRFKPPQRRSSRQDEVRDIAFALTEVAQEFNVPVIAAAQLNRGHAGRKNKEPIESDMRESDAIIHEASVVLFLYRPWKDGESEDPTECHLLCRKTRKAGESRCRTIYRPQFNSFEDVPTSERAAW